MTQPEPTAPAKPEVELVGHDGNAFAILARCRGAARRSRWTEDQFRTFQEEAMSGDYDKLLATVTKYFNVS